MPAKKIAELLGDKAEFLLNHQSKTISKEQLHLPGPDFVDRIWINSDRNPAKYVWPRKISQYRLPLHPAC